MGLGVCDHERFRRLSSDRFGAPYGGALLVDLSVEHANVLMNSGVRPHMNHALFLPSLNVVVP